MYETNNNLNHDVSLPLLSKEQQRRLLKSAHVDDISDSSRVSQIKSNIDNSTRLEQLKNKGVTIDTELANRQKHLDTNPYSEYTSVPLNIQFNGKPCFLNVHQFSRFNALNELSKLQKETNFTRRLQAKALINQPNVLANISISVTYDDGQTNNVLLGYSDLTVYYDPTSQRICVAGPLNPHDLAGERISSPAGFNNTLKTALAVRSDALGIGLGGFLVEIGSAVAAHSYFATERLFPSDSTDKNNTGSFYVNTLGAHIEERIPYYDSKNPKPMPVLPISRFTNTDILCPLITNLSFAKHDGSQVAELLSLVNTD